MWIKFKGSPKRTKKIENNFIAKQELLVKNVSLKMAMNNLPKEFLPVLIEMKKNFKNEHKYVSVDFKIHYLKKGDIPCIPGWHLDTQMNITKGIFENHQLYISGDNSLTDFFKNDYFLKFSNRKKQSLILKDYQDQISKETIITEKIPEKTIINYSRDFFHRGTPAISDGWRILLRVSEQSSFEPINKWNNKPSRSYRLKNKQALF